MKSGCPSTNGTDALQGLGNGGVAGLIATEELGAAMAQGYAATATDAGHTGSPVDATWALMTDKAGTASLA